MQIALALLAFQDAPAAGLTPREGWIAVVSGLVPTAALLWREFSKNRTEREASTIAGYKDLYVQQTQNVTKLEAALAKCNEDGGRLKDLLSAERVKTGSLEIELKYLKAELAERDAAELKKARKDLSDRDTADQARRDANGGGG